MSAPNKRPSSEYDERIGENIGRLVSDVIVDSLTLFGMEKPAVSEPIPVQPKVDPNRLLKAQEIAKKLGVSKTLAYQLMQKGEIPTVRIGSAVRVRPLDLEDYIKNNLRG